MKIIIFLLGCPGTLGHFRIADIISREIIELDKKSEITIVSDEDYSRMFDDPRIKYKKIDPPKNTDRSGCMLKGGYTLNINKVINKIKPQALVFETFFPQDLFKQNAWLGIKKFLIVSTFSLKTIRYFFLYNFQKYFDRVIFLRNFTGDISPAIKKLNIAGKKRIKVFGPLVKRVSKKAELIVRDKYGFKKDDFLILATFGGGGFIKNNQRELVKLLSIFLNCFKEIASENKKIKFVVITGPFVDKKFPLLKNDNIIIKKYEPNFPELIKLSNLVICQGGHNTLNEVVLVKTPAIVTPVEREGYDDQLLRAKKLEKKGGCIVLNKIDRYLLKEKIEYLYKNGPELNKIKNNLNNIKLKNENKKLAKFIIGKI